MTFEDLDAWRKARLLVKAIYALTGDAGSLVSVLIAFIGWCGFRFLS
jgi:hypothetical protein